MPRPKCCRRVAALPVACIFKPAGAAGEQLPTVLLTVDEFEALRLADYEGFYQEQAAERMHVSRQTFGRIVESARKKVAQVLVEGCALHIEGGKVEMAEMRSFVCADCGSVWNIPVTAGQPAECPACKSKSVSPAEEVTAVAGGRHGQCCCQGGGGRHGHGHGHGHHGEGHGHHGEGHGHQGGQMRHRRRGCCGGHEGEPGAGAE